MEQWEYPAELVHAEEGPHAMRHATDEENARILIASELRRQHEALQWLLERVGPPPAAQKISDVAAPPFMAPALEDSEEGDWLPPEVDCNT